jgi:hypothetical protein
METRSFSVTLTISSATTVEEVEHRGRIGMLKHQIHLKSNDVGYASVQQVMVDQRLKGIPYTTRNALRKTLLDCCPLDTDLSGIFIDSRIVMWRHQLPPITRRDVYVDKLIDFLYDRYDSHNTCAIILFLYVLRDRVDRRDACHNRLTSVINDLERWFTCPSSLPEGQQNALEVQY